MMMMAVMTVHLAAITHHVIVMMTGSIGIVINLIKLPSNIPSTAWYRMRVCP